VRTGAISPDWIEGGFICMTDDAHVVAAIQCDREVTLGDIVTEAPRSHRTVAGFDLHRIGYGPYLALPESDVILFSDDDDPIADVLRNVAEERPGVLFGSLRDRAAEVSGADIWFACEAEAYEEVLEEFRSEMPRGFGLAVDRGIRDACMKADIGSTNRIWSCVTYASERDCANAERKARDQIQAIRGLLRSGAEDVPREFRDVATGAEDILDSIEVTRRGRSLIREISIDEDFVIDMIRRADRFGTRPISGPRRAENAMMHVANTLESAM
jgi:hypothetical protein